ncbi:MAG: hypothetical protein E6Q97_12170 [Desulfurellales bacterium]|nr:MAG: hypothetical protein E6Q97_12170 [Desulfurellales bacterium]
MKKLVHNVSNGKLEEVDLSIAEIAEITAFQRAEAEREAAPKPGVELLAQIEAAKGIAELKLVLSVIIRQVYGLPEPVKEEQPVEAQAEGGLGATIRRALGMEPES